MTRYLPIRRLATKTGERKQGEGEPSTDNALSLRRHMHTYLNHHDVMRQKGTKRDGEEEPAEAGEMDREGRTYLRAHRRAISAAGCLPGRRSASAGLSRQPASKARSPRAAAASQQQQQQQQQQQAGTTTLAGQPARSHCAVLTACKSGDPEGVEAAEEDRLAGGPTEAYVHCLLAGGDGLRI